MKPFIQISDRQSTIDNWKDILVENDFPSFGVFAYVTDSGVAQLTTYLGDYLGGGRSCRWLFGFDYGRSQPTAIRKIAELGLGDIRIYDGEYVVQAKGFTPRSIFHLKTAMTFLDNGDPCKQIVGSGNLSASGLLYGIEAGCVIDYTTIDQDYGILLVDELEELWAQATPFEIVIDEYEQKYSELALYTVNAGLEGTLGGTQLFWIDVGYVTKNRGVDRPGNQFDLPRGSHVYLGIDENNNPPLNSILGELRFRTPTDEVVERFLRYGNNSMEKLTLPIPEKFGYQSYDGKILVFEVGEDEVFLNALELDDFLRLYSKYISSSISMQSGRRYGTILLNP